MGRLVCRVTNKGEKMLQAKSKICFNDSNSRNDPDEIWFCSILHSRVICALLNFLAAWGKKEDFSQSFIPARED